MSHTIWHNTDLGVGVLRAKRSMDVGEMKAAFDEAVHLPGFEKGLALVVECRGSATPISATEMRSLADYCQSSDARWGTTKWSFAPQPTAFMD